MGERWKIALGGFVVVAAAMAGGLWSVFQVPTFDFKPPQSTPSDAVSPAVMAPVSDATAVPFSGEIPEISAHQVRNTLFDLVFTPAGEAYWEQPVYECRWLAVKGEFTLSFGFLDDGTPWASCTADDENGELCDCVANLLADSPIRKDLAGGQAEHVMPDSRFNLVHEVRDQIGRRLPKSWR